MRRNILRVAEVACKLFGVCVSVCKCVFVKGVCVCVYVCVCGCVYIEAHRTMWNLYAAPIYEQEPVYN